MRLEDLLTRVAPQWREAFVKFVETGDAEPAFLKYVDEDDDCKAAVEAAFTAQAAAFANLAQALKDAKETPESSSPAGRTTRVSATMATSLEGMLDLAPGEREKAVTLAASTLKATVDLKRRKELAAAMEALRDTVASA